MRFNIFQLFMVGVVCTVLASGTSLADVKDFESATIDTEVKVSAGYRATSDKDQPNRAAEYKTLESGPTFDLHFFKAFDSFTLGVDGKFLEEDEYSAAVDLNAKAQVRFSLRTESFVHNLDHIPYANGMTGDWENRVAGPVTEGSRADDNFYPFGSPTGKQIYFSDDNPTDEYQLQLNVNEVKARIKAPDYPAHFNISYWRYDKRGDQQLRFMNHRGTNPTAGSTCTGCHVQSKTRNIDTTTEEIKASVDAHAGYIDMVLETLYRTFRDNNSTPTDGFKLADPYGGWNPALPHDENPDSTLTETTLKLNTAPSGGFVVSTSYTIGKRENKSDLTTTAPITAETDYVKLTADLNYTPNQKWTYNARYRYLDMDSTNSSTLNTYGGLSTTLAYTDRFGVFYPAEAVSIPVRESIDTTRNWYDATLVYRPTTQLSIKAELMREDIKRSYNDMEAWNLPKDEVTIRGKVGFYSRHLEKSALKLRGWAAYQQVDDPAYGISAENQKELFLSMSYTPKSLWGLAATFKHSDEENSDRTVELEDGGVDDTFIPYDLDREKTQSNATLGGWVNLAPGLTLDASYGYLMTEIEQDILFGNSPDSTDTTTNYTVEDEDVVYKQTVHTLRAGLGWQALENLNCRAEGYHIRSKGYMSPDFYVTNIDYGVGSSIMSSTNLREISEFDIRQNGLRGTINWDIDENWSCAVEMTYDDYDEKNNDIYDGSVMATMVSLTRAW